MSITSLLRPAAVIIATVTSLSAGADANAQTRIRFALESTEGSLNYDIVTLFKAEVERLTAGAAVVEIASGGTLGPDRVTLNGLRQGTHQISLIASPVASIEPAIGIFEAPFLIPDRLVAQKILSGPVGEEIMRRITAKGIYALAIGELGFRVMTNNVRPIVKPDDMRGLKMRIPNTPFRAEIMQLYGANATAMAFGEMYIALKQGVIDGQENPIPSIQGGKIYEVQKYLSLTNHLFTPNVFLASKSVFDASPKPVQDAVRQAAKDAAAYSFKRGEELDKSGIEEIKKYSAVNSIDLNAFRDASKAIYGRIAEKSDKGLMDQLMAAVR